MTASKHSIWSYFVLAVCLLSVVIAPTTNAVTGKYDPDFYSGNDIMFYNPEAPTACGSGAVVGGASANIALEKNASLQAIFQALINGGLKNVQAAAVMGNMYAESSFNSGAKESNGIGYGLVQWSFGRRTNLEAFAASKGVPASDIPMQIQFLLNEYNSSYKSRLAGTPFETATDVSLATDSWMKIFEAPLYAPANDPAALNSKRIPAAIKVYGFYKDLVAVGVPAGSTSTTAGGASVSTASCSSVNGAVAGSIVDTALGLALPTPATQGMNNQSDATPAYQTTKAAVNPGGSWSDCGMFVATVMISSKVDPDYPHVVTSTQMAYVKSKPAKYQIIDKPSLQLGSVNTLLPGDILITSGHTEIYTGKSPNPAVDASLGDRVPSVRPMGGLQWMLDSGAIAARIIK